MNGMTHEEVILAIEALRAYQEEIRRDPGRVAALVEEFGRPVTVSDTVTRIDALCERLNCG